MHCIPFPPFQEHISIRFDPHSRSFTLDSVVALRLDQHVEFVAELSVNATKVRYGFINMICPAPTCRPMKAVCNLQLPRALLHCAHGQRCSLG